MLDRTVDNVSTYFETSVETMPATGQEPHPHKRIIVCCDGTWNTGDLEGKALTNVAKIARCISDKDNWKPKSQDGTTRESRRAYIQIVHYQPGVGMGTGKVSNTWDAMTGRGLSKAIRAAYTFICLNWSTPNDQIILIGFSRGAFTVRCVAQFIEEVGLLMKSGLRHLPRLFKIWKTLGRGQDDDRRRTLRNICADLVAWGELVDSEKEDVRIEACAVWDTVSAVGFPMFAHLPQLPRFKYRTVGHKIPSKVKFAVQALALDERRRHFKPMVWSSPEDPENQTLTQRWFAGNHSDVGGGNLDMTLANITLAWMIGQLTDKIEFNRDSIWAITTTRAWSRPSVFDDPPSTETSTPGVRTCKVVAISPISSELLRSRDSWGSFFQRRLGGSQSRKLRKGDVHYSVQIFNHFGIAKYKNLSTERKSPGSDAIAPLKFEGEILDKWAQHILCAHVNIKQTRDTPEQDALDNDQALYRQRLEEPLLPDASYESLIPIAAILSAFHRIALDCDDPKKNSLKEIFERFEAQSKSTKTQNQRAADRSQKNGTFKFECIAPTPTSPPNSTVTLPELKRGENPSTLVLTRTFPLLMGRAHALPKEEQRSTVTRLFERQNNEKVLPCKNCARIWPNSANE
ncbi:hypothetical protein FB567DRAFT_624205 [Paraphoma chrysanthemicola]|uniref:T6SS Phospholipase effector Tle1-like catalytic domain-containing protein n=1 Tax=Paraphoma chrysanthemicola TaxID=798071 RepID=A0A8K0RJM2_9PLEO|nr:hypothetical protein FB567DRAFT_624205 [Paraphoma chrysanthemicola]